MTPPGFGPNQHPATDPTADAGAITHAPTDNPGQPPPTAASRYRLREEIARGGMGVVHRATDTALNREVAVKVLQERFAPTSASARRFVEEATITGQLQHPGIPPVHDVGTLPDGRPFLAMKLIKGRTLDELLKERPDPSAERGRFLAIFEQICQAVAYAHDRRVLHRDLKPANVMVGAFGEVQVMDWGLAKVLPPSGGRQPPENPSPIAHTATQILSLRDSPERGETQAGSVLGTPAFMPPEQAVGAVDLIDRRSDVFGLGAILAVVLTGQPPFTGATAEELRLLAAQGKVGDCFARLDACGAEPELVALAKRCLAAERGDRPADAGAVAATVAKLRTAAEERARQAELDRVRAEGARATAEAEAEAREQRQRRRTQLVLAVAIGLLLAGGGAVAWWQDRQARAAEEMTRVVRNADALAALMGRCEGALRAEDADAAAAALAEAERRLPEGGGDAVADRLARCHADLGLLQDLDRIDQFGWAPVDDKLPDQKTMAALWRAAFDRFGVSPGQARPEETARRVNESLLRDRLLTTLDLWLASDPSAPVRAVLGVADPGPYRAAVRDAVLAKDGARLAKLAGRAEAMTQPPGFAAVLGQLGGMPVKRRRAVLEVALHSHPDSLSLLMGLGNSYPINHREGADERVRWFQAAIAAHPKNIAARNNLGLALKARGDVDGAIAEFRAAIRLDPKLAATYSNLGNALSDKGNPDGAVAEFKEAIRLDPKLAYAHCNLGNVLSDKGDLDQAIAEYREAIRHDPQLAAAHCGLGNALSDKGDLDQAIACYREAIRLDPKLDRAHNGLGNALFDKEDMDGAIAEYRAAIRLGPKYAPSRNGLGNALLDKGDVDGAIACFQEAIRLDPEYVHARNGLGNALLDKGDVDGAIASYREAIRLDPKLVPAHFNLGNALLHKGDLHQAIACYREVIYLDPKLAPARNNLRQAERWRELLPRLPDVATGRAEPATPAEAVEFATLCGQPFQRRYAAAARLCEAAFAADQKLADDLDTGHRYDAACHAALAAARKGVDSAPLNDTDRANLRSQALTWLRADLAQWRHRLATGTPTNRQAVAQALAHWLVDPDLATLRPGPARQALPAAERAAWDKLWAEVRSTLATAQKPPPPSAGGK